LSGDDTAGSAGEDASGAAGSGAAAGAADGVTLTGMFVALSAGFIIGSITGALGGVALGSFIGREGLVGSIAYNSIPLMIVMPTLYATFSACVKIHTAEPLKKD